MIFCFSGTGNSKHVAETIASRSKQEIVMITEKEILKNETYTITDGLLGFVFPIYWWGMPKLVEEFVKTASISIDANTYTFAVCTFGLVGKNGLDDLDKVLWDKGIIGVLAERMVDEKVF